MKRSYPKFLSSTPSFMGLNFVDLGLMAIALFVSMILGLSSLTGTALIVLFIGANRIVVKSVDITALTLRKYKVRTVDLLEIFKIGDQG